MYIGDWVNDLKHGFGIKISRFGEINEELYFENDLPSEYEIKKN